MPIVSAGGIDHHYAISGPADAPWLLLSNSLGTHLGMWQPVVEHLQHRFRIVRYDTRGHGQSSVPAGPYRLDQLGGDVVALMDALQIERAHIAGISLGGLIAQWLAIHAPQRVERLILANTASLIGSRQGWQQRIATIQQQGMATIAESTPARWFRPDYIEQQPERVAEWVQAISQTSPQGYIACCAALADADLGAELNRISAPVLCIAGRYDPVTTIADADALAAHLPQAQRLDLEASHLSALEVPEAFATAVSAFLNQPLQARLAEQQRYQQGLQVRRQVLGTSHVDRALLDQSGNSAEFQDLITRYAWGEIWTRPGLPRHTRSLLTIAMMVALNREAELRLHLGAAINNGVSRDEIKEVLLQTAIYCGVPAANAAFHLAEQVFHAQDGLSPA